MNEDKKIEDFTTYLMKEIDVDIPSNDFVMNVMQSIEVENASILNYKPLIPKSVWALIILLLLALTVFVLTGATVNYYLLASLDIKILNDLSEIDLFKNIQFSKTFTFSFILFSVFVLFQLYVIKKYFNKQHLI